MVVAVKRYYCTYFDKNYLVRGLAVIDSLRAHAAAEWNIFVICMDTFSQNLIEKMSLPEVQVLTIEQIESGDPALVIAKTNRTRVEYLWTTTPAIILWLLTQHQDIDLLTYLDADLYFYSSPEPIFAELGERSILIHEHRYPPSLKDMEINGKYNVGLMAFRNNSTALNALRWWKERCIESCELDIRNGKCGDQMYLNDWPKRFPEVAVLQHPGAVIAPWNVDQYTVSETQAGPTVDQVPLIVYHFHSLAFLPNNRFRLAYRFYLKKEVVRLIYRPYLARLTDAVIQIRKFDSDFFQSCQSATFVEKIWDFLFSFRLSSEGVSVVRKTLRQWR